MPKKSSENPPNPSPEDPKPQIVHPTNDTPMIPGEILLGKDAIVAFAGRPTVELTVVNHGDRPIQVGSHCHFFEVNRALRFDRAQAFGFRMKIPSGTAVRFEPGEEKRVSLVAFGGNRMAYGINGLTNGSLDDTEVKTQALIRAAEQGFLSEGVA
ncbi:MAG: urease subunit beta [Nitrospirales bacterium]